MNAAAFEQLERAFDEASGLKGPERDRYVRELAARDSAVADELGRMLGSNPAAVDAAVADLRRVTAEPSSGLPLAGKYRLLSPLGEGGWGVVYLAEQPPPVHRLVALKVIKLGMDTRAVLDRFNDERRALAMMDHPCVVGAIDAGQTEDGRPFVVMPLVPGLPLTAFCTQGKLDVRARLELFVRLCRGVEYAHGKGLIHRDLKPGNVLVSVVDGAPLPRIIDFGLSKALASPLTPHSTITLQGQVIGTPEYMSPEQADGRPVDVRGDVYALGAMLYELLAGFPPLSGEALRGDGPEALRRALRERSPAAPSSFAPGLARELDWITQRCLEKEPERRYATVSALADDLERFLRGERVQAGPPARLYRWWRWTVRHRWGAAAAVAIAVSLAGGTGVSLWYAARSARDRMEAQQSSAFLQGIFRGLDPLVAAGRDRELLRTILADAAAELQQGNYIPATEADLRYFIGTAYQRIGDAVTAEPMLERAWMLRARELGSEAPDTLNAEVELLTARTDLRKDGPETFAQARACRNRLGRVYGPESREVLHFLPVLVQAEQFGEGYLSSGEKARGGVPTRNPMADMRECLAWAERVAGPDDPDVLMLAHRLARWFETGVFRAESAPLLAQTQSRAAKRFGPDHPLAVMGLPLELLLLLDEHRYAEAVQRGGEDLPRLERTMGDQSIPFLVAKDNYATALEGLGRGDEAARAEDEVIVQAAKSLGERHKLTEWFRLQRGRFMVDHSQMDEAVAFVWGWDLESVRRVRDSAVYAYEINSMCGTEPGGNALHDQWKAEWERRAAIEGLSTAVPPPRPAR